MKPPDGFPTWVRPAGLSAPVPDTTPSRAGGVFLWPVKGSVVWRASARRAMGCNDGINTRRRAAHRCTPPRTASSCMRERTVGFRQSADPAPRRRVDDRLRPSTFLRVRRGDRLYVAQGSPSVGQTGGARAGAAAPLRDPTRRDAGRLRPLSRGGRGTGHSPRQALPEPSGQVLDELPSDAARAPRASRYRPLIGFGVQRVDRDREPEVAGVSIDDGEVRILVAGMETEPQAEPVRKGDLSSTASEGWMAVDRSFSIMSRGIRWRRFEVA